MGMYEDVVASWDVVQRAAPVAELMQISQKWFQLSKLAIRMLPVVGSIIKNSTHQYSTRTDHIVAPDVASR